MRPNLILKLSLTDDQGGLHGCMVQNLGEDVAMFGERLADDMRAGLAFVGPQAFAQTVKVLEERKFRRDLLVREAERLGERLSDYLEDAEGWHGQHRQDIIKGRK